MPEIQPAFDTATQTWFITKPRPIEAASIRELLDRLGPRYTARGYRDAGELVIRKPSDRLPNPEAWQNRPRPPTPIRNVALSPRPPAKIAAPVIADDARRKALKAISNKNYRQKKTAAKIEAAPPRLAPRAAGAGSRDLAGIGVRVPLRAATAAERGACSEMENRILDLWAADVPGPDIARRVGRSPSYVAANVVWMARRRGDPRAVIRNAVRINDAAKSRAQSKVVADRKTDPLRQQFAGSQSGANRPDR